MSGGEGRTPGWARWLETIASLALLAMLALTVADVLGRYVVSRPVPGAVELIQYAMVLVVFAGLPVVTLRRQHISVGVVDNAFRGRARVAQRAAVALVSAFVLAAQAWVLFRNARGMFEFQDVLGALRLPVYPAGYFMAALSAIAAACCLVAVREPSAGIAVD